MAVCDCGETTARLKVLCTDGLGRPLPYPWKSVCTACAPEKFEAGRIVHPSDQKLWLMDEVEPNEYETLKDGTKKLKDWAQADLEASICREDQDEVASELAAREKKRQQASDVRATLGTKLDPVVATQIIEAVGRGAQAADAAELGLVIAK